MLIILFRVTCVRHKLPTPSQPTRTRPRTGLSEDPYRCNYKGGLVHGKKWEAGQSKNHHLPHEIGVRPRLRYTQKSTVRALDNMVSGNNHVRRLYTKFKTSSHPQPARRGALGIYSVWLCYHIAHECTSTDKFSSPSLMLCTFFPVDFL